MAAELTFKDKVFIFLYSKMGLKNFGPQLMAELPKASPAWFDLVDGLLGGEDFTTRKLLIQQLTSKGFIDRSKEKKRLLELVYSYMAKGLNEEKKALLKFVSQNLALFPIQDDAFRSKVLSLTREKDVHLSAAANELLPKIGINMDDRENFRRH